MPPLRRIICIGGRLHDEDWLGPAVHDYLEQAGCPDGVELVDGGLAGLDLLPLLPPGARVVLVDRLVGHGRPGEVVTLGAGEVAELASPGFGHAAGVPYLLRALPLLCSPPLPAVTLVGADGERDPGLARRVARRAVVEVLAPARPREMAGAA